MKNSRAILAILLALVMLMSVFLVCACKPEIDDNNGDDNNNGQDVEKGVWTLQKIELSGSYKTEYQLNEAFSANGLVVSATMKDIQTGNTRIDDVTSKTNVNSSKFVAGMVGAYVITVSYNHSNVTRYADYNVKVLPYEPAINGIAMTKTAVEYNIPNGQLSTNVNVDDIVVKAVDSEGKVSETALTADAYTLSYYIGATKLDSLENVTSGTYTIQAERKADGQKAFVLVNVTGGINGITASSSQEQIELASDDATATISTQDITVKTDGGADVVVDETAGPCTKLDYKLYSVADDKTETLLDSWTVGAGTYKVKVTATYAIAANKTIDFTVEVTIKVKVKDAGASQYHNYMLTAEGFGVVTLSQETTWLATDDDGNGVSVTAASGKTVAIDTNSKSMDGNSFTHRVKLGGEGNVNGRSIKMTVTETTVITIYAMSSNGTDARTVQLLDQDGNAVSLVDIATLDGTAFTADTTVGGAGLHKIVITVEAGTYYFCSKSGGLNVYGIKLEIGQA